MFSGSGEYRVLWISGLRCSEGLKIVMFGEFEDYGVLRV